MTNVTYRLISLSPDCDLTGQTALTPDLAKLVPGALALVRSGRLGMERTDWETGSGKPRPVRSVLIDAKSKHGEWEIGADEQSESKDPPPAGFFAKKKPIARVI